MNIKIYNKCYDFNENCPNEVINVFKNRLNEINFDLFIKYKEFWPKSKKKVIGNCDICGKLQKIEINSLIDKNRLQSLHYRIICKDCIMSEVGKDTNWKITNSKAQKIAQNKPETLKKNSDSVKLAWSNPETAKNWIDGIKRQACLPEAKIKKSNSMKKLWENEEFRIKQSNNSKGFNGINGIFTTKNSGEIRFDSTYEFFFIFMKDLNNEKIKRFNGSIKYFQDKLHYYFPDFIIENCIYEIKSKYFLKKHSEEILLKKDAAEKFINENNEYVDYYLIFEDELNEIGFLDYKYHLLSFCIDNNFVKLYSNEKNELYGKIHYNKKYYNDALGVFNKWNLLK